MAGGWNHVIDKNTGKLLVNEDLNSMLENGGDVYEFAQEAYGMVYFLAHSIAGESWGPGAEVSNVIENARRNYTNGLNWSPGTDGRLLPQDDDEVVGYLYQFVLVDPENGYTESAGFYKDRDTAQRKLDEFNEHKKKHPVNVNGEIKEIEVR